jgi:hypothetical protein
MKTPIPEIRWRSIRRPAGQKNGETEAKMWNLFGTDQESTQSGIAAVNGYRRRRCRENACRKIFGAITREGI